MSKPGVRPRRARMLALLLGSPFLLGGCDPTIQATVENGIINVSTSLLSSTFQAITGLLGERLDATDPNNG